MKTDAADIEPTRHDKGGYMAENLARLREERGLSTTRLADLLSQLGTPIPATGITRVEKGQRRVDTDELLSLALALKVAPLTLLFPDSAGSELVQLTPNREVTARTAWRWGVGLSPAIDPAPQSEGYPIGPGDDPAAAAEADEREQDYHRQRAEYLALALPPELRRAADQAAVRVARQLAELVEDLVAQVSAEDAAPLLRMARRRHQALGLELEELEEQLKP